MPSAIRSLRIFGKHWGLTAIAVFSLSIAMALGVVSLSVSNTFLLLPPAAPAPERLVLIYTRADSNAIEQVSYPDFEYYRKNNHVFTDVSAAPNSISLLAEQNESGQSLKLAARPVSDSYFTVLGVRPWLGRFFSPGDDRSTKSIAVMTFQCWKRLGSDPNIAGKTVAGNLILGVTPKEFSGSFYGLNGDLLTSLGPRPNDRGNRQYFLLARLRPGVSRAQAQAEMTGLSAQLARAYPNEDRHRTAVVTRATLLPPSGVQSAELGLGILVAVVLLVLLIACANVANLLLAIAVGRRQEASIKLALGAPRGRLLREFLRESAVICVVSGCLGYGIAAAVVARLSDFTYTVPVYGAFSFGVNLRLDGIVAAFTGVLVLIAILATGIAPALYASSPNVAQALSGEIVVGGTGKSFRRNALVAAQVAVCTVVLIGMGLCEQSLWNLRHADLGFAARNLIAVEVYPGSMGYTGERGREFYQSLRARISALPGVESVALAGDLPLLEGNADDAQRPGGGRKLSVMHTVVDADYFNTLGIRLLAGRTFTSRDRQGAPSALVINRKMAETMWPGEDALGKPVNVGDPPALYTVVGIVADGKYEDIDEAPQPFVYYALSQNDEAQLYAIARTHGEPGLWTRPVEGALRELKIPSVFAPVTFENWRNLTLLQERAVAASVGGLSVLGLLLATIGLFGAISYSVSERKKELGIRTALGARPRQLLGMILRQTFRVAGAGILAGLLLGLGLTTAVRSQLYQVGAIEWGVLAAVSAGMLVVSAIVAWLSARPWVRTNPMDAVRHA